MIASNSSPLIVLGKIGKLDLLRHCFQKVIIPETVYQEIREKAYRPEFLALEKALSESWIKREKVIADPLLATTAIGQAEKEVISWAAQHTIIALIDDDIAKSYAAILKVEAHGTLFVIFSARKKGLLSKTKALETLASLIGAGFYMSTELYEYARKVLTAE